MTNNLKSSTLTSSESETERASLMQELALTNTGMLTPEVTTAAATVTADTKQITSPAVSEVIEPMFRREQSATLAEITNIEKREKTSVAATQKCLTIEATESSLPTDHMTSDAKSPSATTMKKFCAYHMTLPPVVRRGKSVAQRLRAPSTCMTSSLNTVANKTVSNSMEQFTSCLTAPAIPQTKDPTAPWRTTSSEPQIMSSLIHNTTSASGLAPNTKLMLPLQNIPSTFSLAPYTTVQLAPQISAPSQAVNASPMTAIMSTQASTYVPTSLATSLGSTFMSSSELTYLLSSSLCNMAVPKATKSVVNLVPYTKDMRTPAGMYPRSTKETHLDPSDSHFKIPTAKQRIAPKANLKTPDVDIKTPDVDRKTPDVGGTRKRTYSKRITNVY